MGEYFEKTKSASYGFVAAIPLLLLYEFLMWVARARGEAEVDVAAYVVMKKLLYEIGMVGNLWLGLILLTLCIVFFAIDDYRFSDLRKPYFLGMLVESAVYAIICAVAITALVQQMNLQAWLQEAGLAAAGGEVLAAKGGPLPGAGLALRLALSMGAGLYEELVFRVILFGGMAWLLGKWLADRTWLATGIAAVVTSLLFSAVHYVGTYGDPFQWNSFVYRFIFGLVFVVIYRVRGFGVAAWTHALYDIMVLLPQS